MDENQKAALLEDIRRQQDTGFGAGEIRANLLAKGYTSKEIAEVHSVTAQTPAAAKSGREYLSILLSVFFIIRGAYLISSNRPTFGVIMVVLGLLGVIVKIVLLSKK